MLFQQLGNRRELFINLRQLFLKLADWIWSAGAGDDILALRIQEIFAVQLFLTGRRVAGEGDAGTRVRAHVAKDHRLHVNGRAQVVRDSIDAAIVARAPAHPGIENRADCDPQLFIRIVGNRVLLSENDFFLSRNDAAQLGRFQIRIFAALGLRFEAIHYALELFVRDTDHNFTEERCEAAVSIEGETQIAGLFGESRYGLFVQAKVQNCVHHARHRKRRARANGNQQWIFVIAEFFADLLFDLLQRVSHLFPHAVGKLLVVGVIGVARFSGDNQSRWDRQSGTGHLA